MVRLCEDVDIIKYEPALCGELYAANQVVATGQNGQLAGTTFTVEGADFIAAGVEGGSVIYLRSGDGSLEGAYEVVSVDTAEQLCVSVLRGNEQEDPIAPPEGTQTTGIYYRIGTLKPQIEEASIRLTEYLGIQPADKDSPYSVEQIVDMEGVRQVCAAAVIAAAYAALAHNDQRFWEKQKYYEALFNKGKERLRIELDTDADGKADSVRFGGCGRLSRQ